MENIVETTRRQNTASAQLPKTKLTGLDRHTAGSHAVITDLPEIVVVSVPDLTDYDPPANQASVATPQRRSMPGVRESASHTSLSRPHVGGLREKIDATEAKQEIAQVLEPKSTLAPSPNVESTATIAPSTSEIATESTIAAPESQPAKPASTDSQTRIDAPSTAAAASPGEPAWRRAIMPMRNRFFSGLFPRRRDAAKEAEATTETAASEVSSIETQPTSFEPAAQAEGIAIAESTITESEALAPTLQTTESVESEIVSTENQIVSEPIGADEATETPAISPTPAELRARELDARERHGRTIARQLFEHPAISHATTLLLVATGGVRRALDAVECIGRGIAWHLDRDVELMTIEPQPEAVWPELPEDHSDDPRLESLRNVARIMRSQTTKRLSTVEIATEEHEEARRLSVDLLQSQTLEAKANRRVLAWLVDSSQTALCESLGATCDATLMLVDLQSSRIDESRWAVTHLRDHGARLVGSLIVNAFEEQP